ncbi:MAG: hypothetical protein LBV55_03895 [Acholeplasmatales bacterium]|jgi:hypothetical protein|nr:hypothetical protein [Acholeplasmatales bacterium]
MSDNLYNNIDIIKLLSLYEKKGKEFYYQDVFSKDEKTISKKFLLDDYLNLASCLEINISPNKIKNIIKNGYLPKNKEEQLFINFVNVFNLINSKSDHLSFNIFDINKIINGINYNLSNLKKSESVKNLLDPSKSQILEQIINDYLSKKDDEKYEYLYLVANVITKFYNEKFYLTFNFETSLFLLYLLIFKKFKALKYCSFFASLYKYQEDLKHAFSNSEYHYKKGIKDTTFIYETLIDIMLDVYKKVDNYCLQYQVENTQSKQQNLRQIILQRNSYFSVKELREEFPNTSKATIDRTLIKLKAEGFIDCQIKGRASFWQVTNKGKEETNISTNLFDE